MRSRVPLLVIAIGCAGAPAPSDAPGHDTDRRVEASPAIEAPAYASDAALRRLSAAEYRRSVEHLLGVPVPADVAFPVDPDTRGFSDQADALEVTPLVFEAYETAGTRVVDALLRRPGAHVLDHVPAVAREGQIPAVIDNLFSVPGPLWGGTFSVPVDGTWRVEMPLRLRTTASGGTVSVAGWVDDAPVGPWTRPVGNADTTVVFEVHLPAGGHRLDVQLSTVDAVGVVTYGWATPTVSGPAEDGPNPARDALVTCDLDGDTEACVRSIVGRIAPRAFRGPLTPDALERLLALPLRLHREGATPDEVLGVALRVLLVHPRFLFHVEPDARAGAGRALDAWELAARLSATLWMSLPDDALLDAAASGALRDDAGIRAQVRRMLADPRADALSSGFLADWLDLDVLDQVEPDPMVYPDFDEELRAAMRTEVDALLRSMVGADRPMDELLTARHGVVPARLAQHYGLGPTAADDVDLAAIGRGGLLGTAALLTARAHPNRSSPTLRGKFVLDKLLCRPPPPPPAAIPPLASTGGTTRDQLEAHAADPLCAGCHRAIDPLGVPLEHFDGVGAWRDVDAGLPVDAKGTLIDGRTVDGLRALADVVVADPAWPTCVATALFTWSLGRPPGQDVEAVAAVAAALRDGGSLDDAVEALVLSEPFRSRRGLP